MSVSTEVQRTLVKSPPELWTELSNPESLGRHLGELGEIRITNVEPETKVEWEAASASGVVYLKQSGWGTKVTLSLTRELSACATNNTASDTHTDAGTEMCAESDAALEQLSEPESPAEPEDAQDDPAAQESKSIVASEPPAQPESAPQLTSGPDLIEPEPPAAHVEVEPRASAQEAQRRRGFFARLFSRRKAAPGTSLATPQPEPPRFEALAAPEPIYPEPAVNLEPPAELEPAAAELEPAHAPDLAAELASVEAQMAQETTELLTGVLDRLGAAHHRPFSRA